MANQIKNYLNSIKNDFATYVAKQPDKSEKIIKALKAYIDKIKIQRASDMELNEYLPKKVLVSLLNIINASQFLNFLNSDLPLTNDDIIKFIKELKIKYNFGDDIYKDIHEYFDTSLISNNLGFKLVEFFKIISTPPLKISKTYKNTNVSFKSPKLSNLKYFKHYDSYSYGISSNNNKSITISPLKDSDAYYISNPITNLKNIDEKTISSLISYNKIKDMTSLGYIIKADTYSELVDSNKTPEDKNNEYMIKVEANLKDYYYYKKLKNKNKSSDDSIKTNSMIDNLNSSLEGKYEDTLHGKSGDGNIITSSTDLNSIITNNTDMEAIKYPEYKINENGTIAFYKSRVLNKNTYNMYLPSVPLSSTKDYKYVLADYKSSINANAKESLYQRANLENYDRARYNNFAVYALVNRGPDFNGNNYIGMFTLESEDNGAIYDLSSIADIANFKEDKYKLPTEYKKVIDSYYVRLQDFNIPGVSGTAYTISFCGMDIKKLTSTFAENHIMTLNFSMDEKGLILNEFSVLAGKLQEFTKAEDNENEYKAIGVSEKVSKYIANTFFPMSFFNNPNKKRLDFTVIYNDYRKFTGNPLDGTGTQGEIQKMVFDEKQPVKDYGTNKTLGSLNSYRGFILEDVKILGNSSGITFSRDTSGNLTLGIDVLFKRIRTIDNNIPSDTNILTNSSNI